MGRSFPKPRTSLLRRRRGALYLESLEDRLLLAGGLDVSIVNTSAEKYVLINPESAEPIKIVAQPAASSQQLFSFFRAEDGEAVPSTIEGRMEVGDQTITGTFTFAELTGRAGVGVTASNAALTFGGSVGIRLSDAGGAIALLPDGLAARLTTDNVSDGVGLGIVGLPGLSLSSSDFSYEINTTGKDTDVPVPTPLGD